MLQFPDFMPAKRPDSVNRVNAGYLQHQGELQSKEMKDQQTRDNIALPAELYGTYSNVTETNPLGDLASSLFKNKAATGLTNAPTGIDPLGGSSAAASAAVPTMPGTWGQAASKMSTMAPTTNVISKGITPAVAPAAAGSGLTAASAIVPGIGALTGAGTAAATGGSNADIAKGALAGGGTSALMTASPALMAMGPPGWAAMAGLAAASLYGMFG